MCKWLLLIVRKAISLLILCAFALPLFAASEASYRWDTVKIGGGGLVSAVLVHPSKKHLVYARTDVGGAYRWDHSAGRWVPLMDWVSESYSGYLGVESFAVDPNAPNRLYLQVGINYLSGSASAILRSEDYGDRFDIVDVTRQFKVNGNGAGRQTGEKLQVDPNNSNVLYAGSRWDGLFKSTDAGKTWWPVAGLNIGETANQNGISFVLLDGTQVDSKTNQTQTLYVGVSRLGSHNLFVSYNGGETFNAVKNAPSHFMPLRAELTASGKLVVTYSDGAGPRSNDGGEPATAGAVYSLNTKTNRWRNITPRKWSASFSGLDSDPKDGNRLVVSTLNAWVKSKKKITGDHIFISNDGGNSWVDVVERGLSMAGEGSDRIRGEAIYWPGSVQFDPFDSKQVWVSSGRGVFRTENIDAASSPWFFTVNGLEESVPLGLLSIPGGPLVSALGNYDGFVHTDLSKPGMPHYPVMGTTTGLAYAANKPGKLVRVGEAMYISNSMGKHWSQIPTEGKNGNVALSANGDFLLHSPAGSNQSYRSSNNGLSWYGVRGFTLMDARIVADPVNNQRFYAYSPTGIFFTSRDGGVSFRPVARIKKGGSKIINTAPGREGDVWLPLKASGLLRTKDGGASFTPVDGVTAAGAVGFGKPAPGSSYPTVYIWGTVNYTQGVFRSDDEGKTWVRINTDSHQFGGPGNGQIVVGDMNHYGRVYMSTGGRGIVFGEPVSAVVPKPVTVGVVR